MIPPPHPGVDWSGAKLPARQRLLLALAEAAETGKWLHTMQLSTPEIAGLNLGARLHEIRARGFVIESKPDGLPSRGCFYRLVSITPGAPRERHVRVYMTLDDAREVAGGHLPVRVRDQTAEAVDTYLAATPEEEPT